MIVVVHTFRGISFFSILVIITSLAFIRMNTKEKEDYDHAVGAITYLEDELGELPVRNRGLYRYLILDTYPFPFEIYADDQAKRVDSLSIGDTVTVHFYETGNIQAEKLNRHIQYFEKNGVLYFKRNGFQRTMGFVMIGISLGLILFAYVL